MRRYWRIFKIRIAGKYSYLKRVHKWRRGQLFRDLQFLTPEFLPKMLEKYGKDELAELPPFEGSYFETGRLSEEMNNPKQPNT